MADRPRARQRGTPPRAAAALALSGDLSTRLRLGDLSLEGSSRAGDSTWFRVHPPGLAFDVGRGAPELEGAADLFVTHGHLDHALGLPFVVSQRTLAGLGTRIVCPRALVADVEGLLAAASRLERADYRRSVVGVAPGDRIEVAKGLAVEAFAVDHRVPGLGYHLVRTRRVLRADLRDEEPSRIAERRRAGESVDEPRDELWLSYPGDTGAGVFALEPRLAESRIVMLECTFLAERHRERAAGYGHLHLDDIVTFAARARCETIVLYHLSRRHSFADLRAAVAARLPGEVAARIRVFGAP